MQQPDLWFRELHKDQVALSLRVKDYLWSGRSEHQTLDILDTEAFGRVLLLDGILMTTEKDEYVYHEMIVHVPAFSHPNPQRVLVIGGGDGGSVREALKHPSVDHVDLVEIDALVVEKSREYLPTISCTLDHPKVKLHVADGIRWVADTRNSYDVIIVDSTDPVGPAAGLFSASFYRDCLRALVPGGILTAQTGSPYFDAPDLAEIYRNLRSAFPDTRPYLASIPSYPGGLWSFAFAPNGEVQGEEAPEATRFSALEGQLRYYSPEVHRAAFALPPFFRDAMAAG